MLYRATSTLVEAIQVDGSERVYRTILAMPNVDATYRRDGVEIRTSDGPQVLRHGQWLTKDLSTGLMKVHDDAAFSARHEAILRH